MAQFNCISPQNLMRLIGTPDAPVVVDVRIPDDVAADPRVIPTTVSYSHKASIAALIAEVAHRDCVVVCQKGLKLSHGVAALLRDAGLRAEVLEGGFAAWAASDLPLVPIAKIPDLIEGRTRWVTRHRPKIDRIACPWLIRRFIDPTAQFMFVPPSDVLDVADRFNAIPFDIENVSLTHRDQNCTFDAIIDDFGLHHNALDRLADVVRAADTDTHDASPQAAGLLALSVGLSRMHRDDVAQLDAAMPLYDALYRWARDGFDEGHDWPAGRAT